jgi:hypothetical protein
MHVYSRRQISQIGKYLVGCMIQRDVALTIVPVHTGVVPVLSDVSNLSVSG